MRNLSFLLKFHQNTTKSMIRILIFLILLGIQVELVAQSKASLESKKKENEKELAYTSSLLKEIRGRQTSGMKDLKVLVADIENREELLRLYQEEISLYQEDIQSANRLVDSLKKKQEQIKETYAQIIVSTYYQSSPYDKWLYVFSSKDFEQAFNRYKYFQQFADYAQIQLEQIQVLEDSIHQKIVTIADIKSQKEELSQKEKEAYQQLASRKKEKETQVKSLKAKEKDLQERLRVQKQRAKNLEAQIHELIVPKKGVAPKKLSTQEIKLGKNFTSNKGKLPWPVSTGFISSRFGEHAHPLLPGVKINNDGVDISTQPGSVCKAIFDGEVSLVSSVPGLNNVIIVRHGEYLSVYTNLKDLKVKKGSQVKTGQALGTVATTANETILKLQVWKGATKQNPLLWIRKS